MNTKLNYPSLGTAYLAATFLSTVGGSVMGHFSANDIKVENMEAFYNQALLNNPRGVDPDRFDYVGWMRQQAEISDTIAVGGKTGFDFLPFIGYDFSAANTMTDAKIVVLPHAPTESNPSPYMVVGAGYGCLKVNPAAGAEENARTALTLLRAFQDYSNKIPNARGAYHITEDGNTSFTPERDGSALNRCLKLDNI